VPPADSAALHELAETAVRRSRQARMRLEAEHGIVPRAATRNQTEAS